MNRKKFQLVGTLALVLSFPHPALAQATLTAMDYIEIHRA